MEKTKERGIILYDIYWLFSYLTNRFGFLFNLSILYLPVGLVLPIIQSVRQQKHECGVWNIDFRTVLQTSSARPRCPSRGRDRSIKNIFASRKQANPRCVILGIFVLQNTVFNLNATLYCCTNYAFVADTK